MDVLNIRAPNGMSVKVFVADTFLRRLRGSYGRKLAFDEALWLRPCNAVHTIACGPFGMLFLDRTNRVTHAHGLVLPNRFLWHTRAYSVVEFPVTSPLSLYREGDELRTE